ncbi:MAG: phosphopantetheine-binding protein [Sporomusaceae bacterium]|nr:phosphopantetheine-binding protein [Sporomusaceae bacterium]
MSTIEKLNQVILKLRKKNITADMLTPEARFQQDLGFDSQDQTELLVLAEDAFKISMELSDVKDLTTIAAAVAYIDKKLAK